MDNSQDTQQLFRLGYQRVFDALVAGCADVGLKVKDKNPALGRVTASAGMSLMSWGEDLTFTVEEEGENRTRVRMTSTAKVGSNIASRSRHGQHFEKILSAMSTRLGL